MPGYGFNCSCYGSSLIASTFTKDRLRYRPVRCHFKTSRVRLLEHFWLYMIYSMIYYLCQFVKSE